MLFQSIGNSQWIEKSIMTTETLTSVVFSDENIGFVTASNQIFKTSDGGDTWSVLHTANNLVLYEDVSIIDNSSIIAVGKDFEENESVITLSNDGGATWSNIQVQSTSNLRSVYFPSEDIGYCSGSFGTILKSNDSGNSWVELDTEIQTTLLSTFFVNDSIGFAVGGQPTTGEILKTIDGGNNWSIINSPSVNFLQSVYFTNSQTGYCVGWNGEILKTEDCGNTWTIQNSVSMDGNLEITFTDENTGYITGGNDQEFKSLIQKTINGGQSWEDISPETSNGLTSIHFPTSDIGYAVGANGLVVKTESGGITSTTNNLNQIKDFEVFPNPANSVLNIRTTDNDYIKKIRIFNNSGILIDELNLNSKTVEMNISALAANMYYVEIHSQNTKTVRMIVKK